MKIVGGVAFYVERFYEKSWFEIIELSFSFFVFLAINRRIFEILIWNLQRICILWLYRMSLKGIWRKLFLTILSLNYYWKKQPMSLKKYLVLAISRSIFDRFWISWYHYDRKRKFFNLNTKDYLSKQNCEKNTFRPNQRSWP